MSPIQLRREHVEAMIAHARETAPQECCGLIGGVSELKAITLYRLRNVTPRPESAYEAAPEDLFAAQRQMRERGEEFFNAAAERLFGMNAAEALHQNIYAVVTPQSAASVRSILSSRLIGGARQPESLILLTKSRRRTRVSARGIRSRPVESSPHHGQVFIK